MHPARIAELLYPFLSTTEARRLESDQSPGLAGLQPSSMESALLSPLQLHRISIYIDILLRWNARVNLTAIRGQEEIVTRHFGESLFAARHLFPGGQRLTTGDALAAADLGSGAGFPGIPLKLWAPGIALTLVESNHKKAAFLREVSRVLTLTDINIQNVRAETLPAATFDVVTLRAVERSANILTTAARLLAPAGRLALLISSPQLETARSTLPQFSWNSIPIPSSHSRLLVLARLNHEYKQVE